MTAQQPSERDEVAAVVRALLRTERTFRTYPPDDPIQERSLAALEPRLSALLPLDLEVRPDQLFWKRQPLLDPNEPSDLPARLHRDGIRRLILGTVLRRDELCQLLRAFATRIHPDDPNRDYVTLLWEADLPNVRVVAIDPWLDLDVPDEVLDGDTLPSYEPEGSRAALPAKLAPAPEEAFRLTPECRQSAGEQVARLDTVPCWPSFVEALLENLRRPQRRERVEQIAVLLEQSFERLLIEQRFDIAARLLTGVRGALPVPAQFPIRQALERIAHPERLALIVSALERGTCTEDQAETLFLGFGEWASESLCALLVRAHGDHLRRLYVDILVKSGTGGLEPVMAHLLHAEPSARKYFARVLGRLKDADARAALISCLRSDDATLRAEAVVGLSLHSDDEIRTLLWDLALRDREPEVRIAALRFVIQDRAGVDCSRVIKRLESTDPKLLDEQEQELLFKALGTGGGEQALGYLANSLRGRWMAGRSEQEGWRRAAMALAAMGTPAAAAVLRSHAQGRGKLASICQDALLHVPAGASARNP